MHTNTLNKSQNMAHDGTAWVVTYTPTEESEVNVIPPMIQVSAVETRVSTALGESGFLRLRLQET